MNTMKLLKIVALSIGLCVAHTSCDMTDFGDINRDPNKPSEANTAMMFTMACTYVVDFSMNSNYYNPWTQMFPGYMSEKNTVQYGKFEHSTFSTSGYYLYPLKNCHYIIQLNTDEATRHTPAVLKFGSNANQIAAAKTLMSFIYMHLTDALGPIPCSEAFQAPKENFQPKFDTQKEVYEKLEADLCEAYGQFDASSSLTTADILFDGKIDKWKKFNATTRMLLAIKLADVDPQEGQRRFARAYADGGMVDNADNLMFKFNETSVGYLYHNGTRYTYNLVPHQTIVDQLKALGDTRLFQMCSLIPFGKTQEEAGVTDEELKTFENYHGLPLGISTDELTALRSHCCFYHPSLTQVAAIFPVITASRVLLVQAEAALRGWISANPASLYEAGIRASYEQWGAEWSDAYLQQPVVALTGSTEEQMKKIALQRWISGFMADGIEAWSDWRRFEVPTLSVGTECVTIDHIPYRHQFAGEIYNANRENYEAGVKADLNGEDTRDQRVWWNRK